MGVPVPTTRLAEGGDDSGGGISVYQSGSGQKAEDEVGGRLGGGAVEIHLCVLFKYLFFAKLRFLDIKQCVSLSLV